MSSEEKTLFFKYIFLHLTEEKLLHVGQRKKNIPENKVKKNVILMEVKFMTYVEKCIKNRVIVYGIEWGIFWGKVEMCFL